MNPAYLFGSFLGGLVGVWFIETLIRFVVKRPYLPVAIAWAAAMLISIWGNDGLTALSVVIYSLAALTLGTIRVVEEKKRRDAGATPPTTE